MFAVLYRRPECGFQGGLDARNLGVRPALRRASLGAAALALTVVLEERKGVLRLEGSRSPARSSASFRALKIGNSKLYGGGARGRVRRASAIPLIGAPLQWTLTKSPRPASRDSSSSFSTFTAQAWLSSGTSCHPRPTASPPRSTSSPSSPSCPSRTPNPSSFSPPLAAIVVVRPEEEVRVYSRPAGS